MTKININNIQELVASCSIILMALTLIFINLRIIKVIKLVKKYVLSQRVINALYKNVTDPEKDRIEKIKRVCKKIFKIILTIIRPIYFIFKLFINLSEELEIQLKKTKKK